MRKSRAAVVLAVMLIAAATVVPVRSPHAGVGVPSGAVFCILCGERGLADFLLNLGLYAPFGMALGAVGRSWLQAVLSGGLLSFGIEALQIFVIAGRDASVGDLISNTLGSGFGWGVWWAWQRRDSIGGWAAALLPALTAAATVAVLMTGLALLTPSFPNSRYYLQWTADLGNLEVYEGEVVSTRVGPLSLAGPPGPIERSDSVRRLLQNGAGVEMVVRAGPPPPALAPIFSIYDHRQREIMLLGADGTDLVYRYRILAARLGLDRADVRFPGLLAEVRPGDTVRLAARRRSGAAAGGPSWCAHAGERIQCLPDFTADRTWTLLYYRAEWSVGVRTILGLLWMAGLFFPAGFLGARWRDRGGAVVILIAGLTALPAVLGYPATPALGLLAAATGVGMGGQARSLTERRSSPSLPA